MKRPIVTLILSLTGLLGSGSPAAAAPPVSASGVMYSPSPCSLLKDRDDLVCAAVTVPLQATLRFLPRSPGGTSFTATGDQNGEFKVVVKPGRYRIRVVHQSSPPTFGTADERLRLVPLRRTIRISAGSSILDIPLVAAPRG